jgi:muskelin
MRLSSAHGQSFHTSIWYVALNGIKDERFVSEITKKHEEVRPLHS